MNFERFNELYELAKEKDTLQQYILDIGWQDWFDELNQLQIDPAFVLTMIYQLQENTLRTNREEENLSRVDFCRKYGIPKATVFNWEWENAKVQTPPYTKKLIDYTFFSNRLKAKIKKLNSTV